MVGGNQSEQPNRKRASNDDSYGRAIRQFRKSLGHDHASVPTAEDTIRSEGHRIAEAASSRQSAVHRPRTTD
jgi:hypothetical protein